jgi:hypothetical protein
MQTDFEKPTLSWPPLTFAPINLWSFPAAWKSQTQGEATVLLPGAAEMTKAARDS